MVAPATGGRGGEIAFLTGHAAFRPRGPSQTRPGWSSGPRPGATDQWWRPRRLRRRSSHGTGRHRSQRVGRAQEQIDVPRARVRQGGAGPRRALRQPSDDAERRGPPGPSSGATWLAVATATPTTAATSDAPNPSTSHASNPPIATLKPPAFLGFGSRVCRGARPKKRTGGGCGGR